MISRFTLVLVLAGGLAVACGSDGSGDSKAGSSTAATAAAKLSKTAPAGRLHVVSQKDKKFLPESLTIRVGDTVNFRNDDKVFHNVYSFSTARLFDLGSYASGQEKKVVFDKAGEILVECAIHPKMRMKITVEK